MRIITGFARGTKLETLEGNDTRPTLERVKEAVFSAIQNRIEGRRVLDLFAGSGQLGLECLSRGAESAVFVDGEKKAVEVIKSNVKKTHFEEKARVYTSDYLEYLKVAKGKEKFDIVFLDPPFSKGMMDKALKTMLDADVLSDRAMVICESDTDEIPKHDGYEIYKHKKYGRVNINILIKNESEEEVQ